ncbi:class I SAM-dependent methyltransferase [Pararhizobium haloflavum]|uniref:class I SAM-dependent methyltransferase n=1 Tax=Pararhizobium haloflavum TaxID=2037914 RepID=UPI000C18FF94|nr:SAM-dependent methyltransferase [Pararhizobium haloflavum]
MAGRIDIDGFEDLFRSNPDPWEYESSPFEAHKRKILLNHIGLRCRGRVLELACANGVTTQALLRCALRLTALDSSTTAIAQARARLTDADRLRLIHGELPYGMPKQQFDLIVVSEIVYYLHRSAYTFLARELLKRLALGGRVVVLHHHVNFTDATVRPEQAHCDFVRLLGKRLLLVRSTRTARYSVSVLVAVRHG